MSISDHVRGVAAQLNLSATLRIEDTNDWQAQPLVTLSPATVEANSEAYMEMVTNGTFAYSGNIILYEIANETTTMAIAEDHGGKQICHRRRCLHAVSHPYVEDFIHSTFVGKDSSSTVQAAGSSATSVAISARWLSHILRTSTSPLLLYKSSLLVLVSFAPYLLLPYLLVYCWCGLAQKYDTGHKMEHSCCVHVCMSA